MNVVIETPRLFLRTFTVEDAPLIYDLNLDPEVTKYTHDPMTDVEHAKEVLEKVILPQYALYNYGRWAIHLRSSLEFIGWCGLKYLPEQNEIDLGYRLRKKFWGKGYATEAAAACIKYGFEKMGLNRIIGRAEIDNADSCKVLKNCGLQYVGEEVIDGFPVKTYEIYNPLIA